MDPIAALILLIVFGVVAWLGFYICGAAGFPPVARIIWGAVCLVILLCLVLQIDPRAGLHGWPSFGAHPR